MRYSFLMCNMVILTNFFQATCIAQHNTKNLIMDQSTVQLKQSTFFGITVRTSNKDEMNPKTAKIPGCIQQFYGQKLYEKIVNPINPAIAIGAYTNYVSDHTDYYTYFIGMEVADTAECPAKLEKLVIPARTYVEFTTDKGKMPDILVATWQKIWHMTPQDFGASRAYKVDFELYDQTATDYSNVQSKVYIGIHN